MKKLMVLVVLASAAGAGWPAPTSDDGDEFTAPVKQEEKVEKTKPEIKDAAEAKPKKKARKCFNCRGKGIVVINTKDICDRCDGKGVLESEVILRNKRWADGWGGDTKKSVNRQPCPRCNRSGKMNVKKEIECPKCKGKGAF